MDLPPLEIGATDASSLSAHRRSPNWTLGGAIHKQGAFRSEKRRSLSFKSLYFNILEKAKRAWCRPRATLWRFRHDTKIRRFCAKNDRQRQINSACNRSMQRSFWRQWPRPSAVENETGGSTQPPVSFFSVVPVG
jgi:hypothetical protein